MNRNNIVISLFLIIILTSVGLIHAQTKHLQDSIPKFQYLENDSIRFGGRCFSMDLYSSKAKNCILKVHNELDTVVVFQTVFKANSLCTIETKGFKSGAYVIKCWEEGKLILRTQFLYKKR